MKIRMALSAIGVALVCLAGCSGSGGGGGTATVTVTASPSIPATATTAPPTSPATPAAPIFQSAPVMGQLDLIAGDADGYRLAGSAAVPLALVTASYPTVLASCQARMASWDLAAVGAIQIDLSAVDQTPAGFTLPATTKLTFHSGGTGLLIVAPTPVEGVNYSPCTGAPISTGRTSRPVYVLVPAFLTPAQPQGDVSRVSNELSLQALDYTSSSSSLGPALEVLSCSGSGAVVGSRAYVPPVIPGAAPPRDACALSLG